MAGGCVHIKISRCCIAPDGQRDCLKDDFDIPFIRQNFWSNTVLSNQWKTVKKCRSHVGIRLPALTTRAMKTLDFDSNKMEGLPITSEDQDVFWTAIIGQLPVQWVVFRCHQSMRPYVQSLMLKGQKKLPLNWWKYKYSNRINSFSM